MYCMEKSNIDDSSPTQQGSHPKRHRPRANSNIAPYVVVVPKGPSTSQDKTLAIASNSDGEQSPSEPKTRPHRNSAPPPLAIPAQEITHHDQVQMPVKEGHHGNKRLSFTVMDRDDDSNTSASTAPKHLVLEIADDNATTSTTPIIPLDLPEHLSGNRDSQIIIHIPENILEDLADTDPSAVEEMVNELLKETFGITDETQIHITGLKEILAQEVAQVIKGQKTESSSSAGSNNSTSSSSSDNSSSGSTDNQQIKMSTLRSSSKPHPKEMTAALRHAVLEQVKSRSELKGTYKDTGDEHRDFRTWMLAELDARDQQLRQEQIRLMAEHERVSSQLKAERIRKLLALGTAALTTTTTIAGPILTYFLTKNTK